MILEAVKETNEATYRYKIEVSSETIYNIMCDTDNILYPIVYGTVNIAKTSMQNPNDKPEEFNFETYIRLERDKSKDINSTIQNYTIDFGTNPLYDLDKLSEFIGAVIQIDIRNVMTAFRDDIENHIKDLKEQVKKMGSYMDYLGKLAVLVE